MISPKPKLVIGIGNPFRSDDAVGLKIAQRLQPYSGERLKVIEFANDPLNLWDQWQHYDDVRLIDAIPLKKQPGRVHQFDAARKNLPTGLFQSSTHNLGIAEAIEMARALGKLPRKFMVYAIEGKNFGFGQTLSPELEMAIEKITSQRPDRLA
jgi:hydrogenase maturation protease